MKIIKGYVTFYTMQYASKKQIEINNAEVTRHIYLNQKMSIMQKVLTKKVKKDNTIDLSFLDNINKFELVEMLASDNNIGVLFSKICYNTFKKSASNYNDFDDIKQKTIESILKMNESQFETFSKNDNYFYRRIKLLSLNAIAVENKRYSSFLYKETDETLYEKLEKWNNALLNNVNPKKVNKILSKIEFYERCITDLNNGYGDNSSLKNIRQSSSLHSNEYDYILLCQCLKQELTERQLQIVAMKNNDISNKDIELLLHCNCDRELKNIRKLVRQYLDA